MIVDELKKSILDYAITGKLTSQLDKDIPIDKLYEQLKIDNKLSANKKIAIMNEWYQKNIETLKEFKITEEIINFAAHNINIMEFREGAEYFLKILADKDIPVIIISAGVGNIIKEFLIKHNCYYQNIYICSNFLEYKNGIVSGVEDNNLIHPLNKNEVSLRADIKRKIKSRNNILLLGNNIEDINMANRNKTTYKLGFLDEKIDERLEDFKNNFDIICTNNTSYKEICEKINLFTSD